VINRPPIIFCQKRIIFQTKIMTNNERVKHTKLNKSDHTQKRIIAILTCSGWCPKNGWSVCFCLLQYPNPFYKAHFAVMLHQQNYVCISYCFLFFTHHTCQLGKKNWLQKYLILPRTISKILAVASRIQFRARNLCPQMCNLRPVRGHLLLERIIA